VTGISTGAPARRRWLGTTKADIDLVVLLAALVTRVGRFDLVMGCISRVKVVGIDDRKTPTNSCSVKLLEDSSAMASSIWPIKGLSHGA